MEAPLKFPQIDIFFVDWVKFDHRFTQLKKDTAQNNSSTRANSMNQFYLHLLCCFFCCFMFALTSFFSGPSDGLDQFEFSRHLHHLQYLTSFERRAGHEGDGGADVTALYADHVGVLVFAKVGDLLGLL